MSDYPQPGEEFRVRYPFVKDEYQHCGEDGPETLKSWRPGVSIEVDRYEGTDIWAESEGEMILTVVGVFKPGRFPTRVFYTRQFIDPDAQKFGKGGLKMCTLEKFRRISAKYQVAYDLEETFEQAAERRLVAAHPAAHFNREEA